MQQRYIYVYVPKVHCSSTHTYRMYVRTFHFHPTLSLLDSICTYDTAAVVLVPIEIHVCNTNGTHGYLLSTLLYHQSSITPYTDDHDMMPPQMLCIRRHLSSSPASCTAVRTWAARCQGFRFFAPSHLFSTLLLYSLVNLFSLEPLW